MPWFKVDDNLAFHAKTLAAGNDAMGLWVRAGSWCAQQLTDGVVPTHVIGSLGTPKQARRLVEAGLWKTHEKGFVFHGWEERQPSRSEVETKREAARSRMAQVRASRSPSVRANTSRTDGASSDEVTSTPTRPIPDPTPKVPAEPSSSPRKRGTRLPDPFPLRPDLIAWARDKAPNAGVEDHERFCRHWWSATRNATKMDWDMAWQNWMSTESERRTQRTNRPQGQMPTERAAEVARIAADLQARHDAQIQGELL